MASCTPCCTFPPVPPAVCLATHVPLSSAYQSPLQASPIGCVQCAAQIHCLPGNFYHGSLHLVVINSDQAAGSTPRHSLITRTGIQMCSICRVCFKILINHPCYTRCTQGHLSGMVSEISNAVQADLHNHSRRKAVVFTHRVLVWPLLPSVVLVTSQKCLMLN